MTNQERALRKFGYSLPKQFQEKRDRIAQLDQPLNRARAISNLDKRRLKL